MDNDAISRLRASFSDVARNKTAAAALFYERLFAIDPALKPMFMATDMEAQGAKLMSALGLVIQNLHRFEEIGPVLDDLAVRHAGYGVEERHYETVGKALVQTLALALGPAFDADMRKLWTSAYGAVADRMIAAQRLAGRPDVALTA